MVALVIYDRRSSKRPEQTIDFTMIITLLSQRGLHVCDHLVGRQIVIGVDRTVVCVIGSWVVAPSRDPVSPIPSIPSTVYENDAVVMIPPPVPVVPL